MKRTVLFVFTLLLLACAQPKGILLKGAVLLSPGTPPRTADLLVQGPYIAGIAPSIEPGANVRVVDLEGACVTPGFVDAHGHLLGLGQALREVDLRGAASFDDVVERVARRAMALPEGQWILGRGWDQNLWPGQAYPTHEALSRAVPRHPVVLDRVDGHALLANALAMERAGVTASTPGPEGGEIVRDLLGDPTGIFVDNAEALIQAAVPEPGPDERKAILLEAMDHLARLGIVHFGDAGTDRATLAALFELEREGRMKVRVNVMLSSDDPVLLDEWFRRGPLRGPWITVATVKAYADGALGSRGAYLFQDYADRPGHRGFVVTPQAELAALARRCTRSGFQLAVHAIGDAAAHLCLKAFADAGARGKGFRLEHLQVLQRPDLALMKALGVTASMMPYHYVSDLPMLEARLGHRTALLYPWRELLGARIPLVFGTDCPVELADPRQGFLAAVERRPGALSPAEALEAYALAHARLLGEDGSRGRLLRGHYADLTVWRGNIPADPSSIQVMGTMVNGTITWWSGP